MEVAVVLSQMGLDVPIVEMLPKILMATTLPEFIDYVAGLLKEKGIGLRTNTRVTAFETGEATGVAVRLEGGDKLLGGCVMRKGHSAAQHIDFISLAIMMGATMEVISAFQYCTHLELAAKPSDNAVTFAARNAMARIDSP